MLRSFLRGRAKEVRRRSGRRLLAEQLEDRTLLAANPLGVAEGEMPIPEKPNGNTATSCVMPEALLDANGDNVVSPLDVLIRVQGLSGYYDGGGIGARPTNPMEDGVWFDTDGNGWLTPADVLNTVAAVNWHGGAFPLRYRCEVPVHFEDVADTIYSQIGEENSMTEFTGRAEVADAFVRSFDFSGPFDLYDDVRLDVDYNNDGWTDVKVQPAYIGGEYAYFDFEGVESTIPEDGQVNYDLRGTLSPDATPGPIGDFRLDWAYTESWPGYQTREYLSVLTEVVAVNTTVTIDDEPSALVVGDDDVVLGTLVYSVGGGSIEVPRDEYIQVRSDYTGTAAPNDAQWVDEIMEDFELRSVTTGLTIDGDAWSGWLGGDYAGETFRFEDVPVTDGSHWEFRVDTDVSIPKGAAFRIEIVQEYDDWNPLAVGEWHTVPQANPPTLSLTERSLGTSDTTVANAQDIKFFRFEATASGEDVFLTQVIVQSDVGHPVSAGDYTLWVDSDSDGMVDTILQSGRGSQNANVIFGELFGGGYTLPDGQTTMFEVHADIAGFFSGSELSIGFADGDANFVEAEEADDGTSLSGIVVNGVGPADGQFVVSTTASKVFELKLQGTLYVTQDTIFVRPRQLLAGELGDPIQRLEFRAEDEPIDVTRLVFTNVGTGTQNINRLKLYREGESTSFASATVDNCNNVSMQLPANSFCAVMESQQLVIPEGERVDVLVRPDLVSDEEGAVNGPDGTIQLLLVRPGEYATAGEPADSTSLSTVCARGFESSNVLLVNDGDTVAEGEVIVGRQTPGPGSRIYGNVNDTVFAKIVSIEDVNPDADGTNVPQGTSKRIAEFKFTAATNDNTLGGRNKDTFGGFVFDVSSTNILFDPNEFDLYNKNDQAQQINCTATGSEGSFQFMCLAADNPNVDLTMDSGESITIVLETDILDNQVNSALGSSLVVSLTNFADRSLTTFGTGADESHIWWSDSAEELNPVDYYWIEYGLTSISSTQYSI